MMMNDNKYVDTNIPKAFLFVHSSQDYCQHCLEATERIMSVVNVSLFDKSERKRLLGKNGKFVTLCD